MPERPKGVACKAMIRGFKSRSALQLIRLAGLLAWQISRAISSVG